MSDMTRPLEMRIDPDSAKPLFEQIQDCITEWVATGVLAEGQKLPPLRQMAVEAGVATETMAKAVRGLVATGLLRSRPRSGTVVARRPKQRAKTGTIGIVSVIPHERMRKISQYWTHMMPLLHDEALKYGDRIILERWKEEQDKDG